MSYKTGRKLQDRVKVSFKTERNRVTRQDESEFQDRKKAIYKTGQK